MSSRDGDSFEFAVPCCILTPQGSELYNVIDTTIDADYLRSVATFLHHAHEVKLEKSEIFREQSEGSMPNTKFQIVEPL